MNRPCQIFSVAPFTLGRLISLDGIAAPGRKEKNGGREVVRLLGVMNLYPALMISMSTMYLTHSPSRTLIHSVTASIILSPAFTISLCAHVWVFARVPASV